MNFFRIRLYQLLHSMFSLEPIHLAATLLHPRYRYLKKCSLYEVRQCHSYIRNRIAQIKSTELNKVGSYVLQEYSTTDNDIVLDEPVRKKQKRFGEEFETGNVSDEYDDERDDELNKYLEQRIDMATVEDNPLTFWYKYRSVYPILSKLARSIYSIPATTANVERQFSAGGLMVNARRARLNPEQVNNALFLRSARNERRL